MTARGGPLVSPEASAQNPRWANLRGPPHPRNLVMPAPRHQHPARRRFTLAMPRIPRLTRQRKRDQQMKTQSESPNVPTTIRPVRDDIRKSNPRLRTIRDQWIRRALAVHSAGTR
jgi:hypothetical protein